MTAQTEMFNFTQTPTTTRTVCTPIPQHVRDMPPCQMDSETSVAAAEGIAGHADALKEQVYQHIALMTRWGKGATDYEGKCDMKLDDNTYRPRRVKLVEEKRVYDSGIRRKAKRGLATVWFARNREMEKVR